MGYTTPFSDSTFGRTVIDFREEPPLIYKEDRDINIGSTMASYCDSIGNFLFYTNGIQLIGKDHERTENGNNLNTGPFAVSQYNSGYKVVQSEFFLPKPGDSDTLYLFHESTENHPLYSIARTVLHQTILDIAANNNLGRVVLKNDPLIMDGTFGGITATKHGNGRDWWVFNSIRSANRYNRLLFTDKGVEEIGEVEFGADIPFTTALGFIVFSPDGSKFARYEVKHGFSVFDFDRCSGTFASPVFIPLPDATLGGWLAISPNSRFLYIASNVEIFQVDLLANDVAASKELSLIHI